MTLRVIGNTTRDIFYLTQSFPVPGESVLAAERKEDVGGKGFNQAVAAVRAGANVCFTTSVGNDAPAEILRTAIDAGFYSIQQLRFGKWFGNVIVCAKCHAFAYIAFLRLGGEKNEWDG